MIMATMPDKKSTITKEFMMLKKMYMKAIRMDGNVDIRAFLFLDITYFQPAWLSVLT